MYKRFKQLRTGLKDGFGSNLPVWQEMALSAVFAVLALLFMSDVARTITNAQANLEVYAYEQQVVNDRLAEQERLESELAYYESYEYARLYARENQNLAEPGERLYQLSEPIRLYQVQVRQKDFFSKTDFSNWWLSLL